MSANSGFWHVHAVYLVAFAGLVMWQGGYEQVALSQGPGIVRKAPQDDPDAMIRVDDCNVRTIRYTASGLSGTLVDHIARNLPLRITGVPQQAVPDFGDEALRLASGQQVIELRHIGINGHVPKRSARRNATLSEVLAGSTLSGAWYAAQVSVPQLLPQMMRGAPTEGPTRDGLNLLPLGVLHDKPNISRAWWSAAGRPLPSSPFLYYYGGRRQDSASPPAFHMHPESHAVQRGPALYIHYDAAENLVQVLDGWKEFLLYDPFQASQLLYGSNKLHGNGSPVNPDSPNVSDEYPLFRFADPRRCVVGSGEWLYVPIYWWHRVRTADARTVALTHWSYADHDKKEFLGKIMCGYSMKPAAFECGA